MNLQVLVLMPFKTGLFQNLMYLFTLFFFFFFKSNWTTLFVFFIKVDYFKFDLFAHINRHHGGNWPNPKNIFLLPHNTVL